MGHGRSIEESEFLIISQLRKCDLVRQAQCQMKFSKKVTFLIPGHFFRSVVANGKKKIFSFLRICDFPGFSKRFACRPVSMRKIATDFPISQPLLECLRDRFAKNATDFFFPFATTHRRIQFMEHFGWSQRTNFLFPPGP